MKIIKHISAIVPILVLILFVMLGRASVASCVLLTVFFTLIWVIEKNSQYSSIKKYVHIVLLTLGAWFFNDLMAIGKINIILQKVGILNFCIYFIFFCTIILFVGQWRWGFVLPCILCFMLGMANAIIKAIRRTPISAGDIFSIRTAMTVAGSYSMEFDKDFFLKVGAGCCILFGIVLFVVLCVRRYSKEVMLFSKKEKWVIGIISGIFWIVLIFTNFFVSAGGKKADYWTHETNGFAYNLYLQLREIQTKEPANYSLEKVENITDNKSDKVIQHQNNPNIIVIMNESFADLGVLGEIGVEQDILPVWHSLKENTIKGNLYVSVYGGNTANSEYEFLTGNSMHYFSERVVPYQLYIHEEKENLFTQMEDLGYDTIFMHPFGAYGWNRPSVYSYFEVNNIYFEENMNSLEYIRQYATDESQYEILKKYLDSSDVPLFLFDVTVQNHGGYTGEIAELKKNIQLENKYKEAENYLNLAYESDRALGEFLEYLQSYPEPTVVVFFGDHQPSVDLGFIDEMEGKTMENMNMEERQKMYITPYFIWANYDIEEKENVNMSLNYLSAYMLQELEMPLTGYQKYLLNLYDKYPVINTVGIQKADGQWLETQWEDSEAQIDISDYHMLIYNYMFDKQNIAEFYSLKKGE